MEVPPYTNLEATPSNPSWAAKLAKKSGNNELPVQQQSGWNSSFLKFAQQKDTQNNINNQRGYFSSFFFGFLKKHHSNQTTTTTIRQVSRNEKTVARLPRDRVDVGALCATGTRAHGPSVQMVHGTPGDPPAISGVSSVSYSWDLMVIYGDLMGFMVI